MRLGYWKFESLIPTLASNSKLLTEKRRVAEARGESASEINTGLRLVNHGFNTGPAQAMTGFAAHLVYLF